jgi:hypothetical protein
MDCFWTRYSTTAPSAGNYACQSFCGDAYVVAGGCYVDDSSARIVRSNPAENGATNDIPEDGECFEQLDGGLNGWACESYLPAGATQTAVAYCCNPS